MSSQNPRSQGSRRRIAGERRPTRQQPPSAATSPPAANRSPERPAKVASPRPTAPAPSSRASSSPSAERIASWTVIAILGVIAVLLVATAAVLGLVKWNIRDVQAADQSDEARKAAPSVAERAAATILSYDYKSLDADQKAAERYMTPKFRKQYASSMKLVAGSAPKLRAKVDAEVKASGVSDADADRADVLVYVDQTTTSTANGGEPQLALNRALFRMKKVDGTWLVDDITSY